MSRNYKIHDQADPHYLTYATVGWVDVLTRPAYKDIRPLSQFDRSLSFGEGER